MVMPNSSCIWRQTYYWIFKRRRRWWWWWLTSFYVTGNKLKEPPIKTNEPGPYFGFGVNQSSEPVTAYQTTMMVLVLAAIWHWEVCCHPLTQGIKSSIFGPASLDLKSKQVHLYSVSKWTLHSTYEMFPKEIVCTSNVFLFASTRWLAECFVRLVFTYYYLS